MSSRATRSTPLRIVELRSTYRDGGGPDKTILLSAARHDPRAFDVRCIYLRSRSDHAFNIGKRAAALHIPFEEVLEDSALDPRAFEELLRRVRAHRPHILHAHDYKTDLLGLALKPFLPDTVLLSTAHGWTQDNARMSHYNRLDRLALRHYAHVVAVSEATRDKLLEVGIPSSRLSVLYNGIEVETWKPGDRAQAAASLRARFELPPAQNGRGRLVGFIGRLSAEKDLPTAMAVAARVLQQHSDVTLLIIGEGAQQDALPGLLAQHGIEGRVKLLGHQRISPEVYQALDVYYMTSLTEGLPNTLLEAMACGIASVATQVGGIPELVGRSESVKLRPAGDIEGLAAELNGLLASPSEAQALGERARARILEAFSFAERLKRIEDIYLRLAESHYGRGILAELSHRGARLLHHLERSGAEGLRFIRKELS